MGKFQKRKKPPSGSFLQGGLSKFGWQGPKQIVCNIGAANLWKTRTIQKKQKEKLRLLLSYRQIQYSTWKNLKNFWAWKSACFLTHQIPFVSFPASFVLKPENPGNALMPILPALAWFPQSLL